MLSMITPRGDFGVTQSNRIIFVLGGCTNNNDCSPLAEAFDSSKVEESLNVWTSILSMEGPRAGLACVAFEGKIFAIGGYLQLRLGSGNSDRIKFRSLDTLGYYNTASLDLEFLHRLPKLPTARCYCAAIVVQKHIIVTGGCKRDSENFIFHSSMVGEDVSIGNVDIYNPYAQAWSQFPSLAHPRELHGMAVTAGHEVLVFGGRACWMRTRGNAIGQRLLTWKGHMSDVERYSIKFLEQKLDLLIREEIAPPASTWVASIL